MYCANCGAQLYGGDKFCRDCGQKVAGVANRSVKPVVGEGAEAPLIVGTEVEIPGGVWPSPAEEIPNQPPAPPVPPATAAAQQAVDNASPQPPTAALTGELGGESPLPTRAEIFARVKREENAAQIRPGGTAFYWAGWACFGAGLLLTVLALPCGVLMGLLYKGYHSEKGNTVVIANAVLLGMVALQLVGAAFK